MIETLNRIRQTGGQRLTHGLSDAIISRFIDHDRNLQQAITLAGEAFETLQRQYPELLDLDEAEQIQRIQHGFVNFYAEDAVNPYVSLAAKGPWLITSKGAVLHDSGGYGMLGFGHAPDTVLEAMNRPHVMANVMTPNFSQLALTEALNRELGHSRADGNPYSRYLCMNSGSEAVSVAARIADIHSKMMTDPGGRHEGKPIRILAVAGGFHGRTDRPARFSDSTRPVYQKYLASFRDFDQLLTVPPNDIQALEQVYQQAEAQGWFIEAFFMEPVMGEGDPGMAVIPAFYQRARELTRTHGSLFLVDSIQAGLRTQGTLSIVDYPGFEKLDAPDMETYSKALNAGQYPLSVLAVQSWVAELYRKGVYGNTMTTNPRALDVACAVLEQVTPALRQNIRERGQEFLDKFNALKDELGGLITKVQGTGLLFSCELDPRFKAYGSGSLEEYLRQHGIGVIHGGENSLRYTPHFHITSEEVDLIVAATRDALLNGPRQNSEAA